MAVLLMQMGKMFSGVLDDQCPTIGAVTAAAESTAQCRQISDGVDEGTPTFGYLNACHASSRRDVGPKTDDKHAMSSLRNPERVHTNHEV